MVDRLKAHLKKSGQPCREYTSERLYAAVLRTKQPLESWVAFVKTELTRFVQICFDNSDQAISPIRPKAKSKKSSEADDEGTPMELTNDMAYILDMLHYLAERGRKVELQTWPDA